MCVPEPGREDEEVWRAPDNTSDGGLMDGFDIATDRLVSAGLSVEGTGHSLASEIAAMEAILGDVRASWKSTEAAPRFAGVMEAHLAAARSLKDALLGHGTTLAAAGRSMAEAETGLAQAIAGH